MSGRLMERSFRSISAAGKLTEYTSIQCVIYYLKAAASGSPRFINHFVHVARPGGRQLRLRRPGLIAEATKSMDGFGAARCAERKCKPKMFHRS